MASLFTFLHLTLFSITFILTIPLLSSSSSSSFPATLADPPLSSSSSPSPFPELSPDIAPLLPSPGGVLPTPIGSDIPTIPSSPSPPNPDDDASLAHGPSSAFSPFGAIQASSNTHRTIASSSSTMAALAGFAACCCFMMIE